MKLRKVKFLITPTLFLIAAIIAAHCVPINTQAADNPTDSGIGMVSYDEGDSVVLLDGSEWIVISDSDDTQSSVTLFSKYNVNQFCTQIQTSVFVTNAINATSVAKTTCKNYLDTTLPTYSYGTSITDSRMMGGEEFVNLVRDNFDATSYSNNPHLNAAYHYANYNDWWNAYLNSQTNSGTNFNWAIFMDPEYLRDNNYWMQDGDFAVSDNFLGNSIDAGMVRSVSASEKETIDTTFGVRPVITTSKNNIGKPVTFGDIQNATYALSGAGNIYPYRGSADFTITPNEGYEVSEVTSNRGTITDNGDGSYSLSMPKRSVTINATVILSNYDITYNLDGGTATNPATYNINTDTFTLNNPTKTGYRFVGWSGTGISGTSTEVTIPQGSTGNREYTAIFEIIDYGITYNLDGGTATNPSTYNVETNTFTLNNPTKTGYEFTGWSGTDIEDTSTEVIIPQGSLGNREYTAIFEAEDVPVPDTDSEEGTPAPDTGANSKDTHSADSIISSLFIIMAVTIVSGTSVLIIRNRKQRS